MNDFKKICLLSLMATTVMTSCDDSKSLVEVIPEQKIVKPNPEDTLVGTVIATQTVARARDREAHSLIFIDTDGDTKMAEYIGALYYSNSGYSQYIQGAGQAFNAERTGMQKTITQWRQTLQYFQPIQKERE